MLNTTRKDLACHYLVQSKMALAQIAYLLGVDDANSFLHAFKSWTAMTPGEYRSSKS